ncbi:MAG TPA: hypothetical protein VHO68_02090, partial [Bacteroidales bacterium]|nr:hypothetical protein [Bacteroidales bacterium]
MKPGVEIKGSSLRFTVWAPEKKKMILHVLTPSDIEIEMKQEPGGYFTTETDKAGRGSLYFYKPDGIKDFPDPASAFQPQGVHGPSQVVDYSSFNWHDSGWRGIARKDLVIYEIHTGTFSKEGNFAGI